MAQINEDQLHQVTVLDELDTETEVAQLQFNSLHSSNAPISSLPEEVLSVVFEAGTQEQGPDFAVLVSHVIGSWRNIALTTSRLWAIIRCEKAPGLEDKPYSETTKQKTAAFLARSKSSPLKIYIRHCFTAEDRQFLQLISKRLERCQHLSIADVDTAELSAVLTPFSRQSAPLLESLELRPTDTLESNFRLTQPLFPSRVPHLTTVQINLLDFTTFHLCLTALQSVTSLHLGSMFIDGADDADDDDAYKSLREGLMALQSLTHLELDEYRVSMNLAWLPAVLPGLQVLRASSSHVYGFLDFLSTCIRAASLTVLVLKGHSQIYDAPQVHFPSLRHLILLYVTKTVPGFGILSRFPSIQRLTCRIVTVRNQTWPFNITDILAALVPGPHEDADAGHRIPCPQLHTIAVSEPDRSYRPLDVAELTAQLSTLKDNGIPIRKLMLSENVLAHAGVESKVMAELRAVVDIEDFEIDWPRPFANERFSQW